MSGPISNELHETADAMREMADELEAEAEAMLGDDTLLNDWMASDLMEEAARSRVDAGIVDALGDAAEWLGF